MTNDDLVFKNKFIFLEWLLNSKITVLTTRLLTVLLVYTCACRVYGFLIGMVLYSHMFAGTNDRWLTCRRGRMALGKAILRWGFLCGLVLGVWTAHSLRRRAMKMIKARIMRITAHQYFWNREWDRRRIEQNGFHDGVKRTAKITLIIRWQNPKITEKLAMSVYIIYMLVFFR